MTTERWTFYEQRIIERPSDPASPIRTVRLKVQLIEVHPGQFGGVRPAPLLHGVYLTPEQDKAIFESIQTNNFVFDAENRVRIHRTLYDFAQNRAYLQWYHSRAKERKRAVRVKETGRKFWKAIYEAGPELFDLLTDALETPDKGSRKYSLRELERLIDRFTACANSLILTGRPGRPSKDYLTSAIYNLARHFEAATGNRPGRPSPVLKRPSRHHRKPRDLETPLDGRFFRFCCSAIRVVEPKIGDHPIDHAIRKALRHFIA